MKRILNWKLVVFAASLLLSSLSFVACDPDKEDEDTNVTAPTYKELIIGKWGVTKYYEEFINNGVVESSDSMMFNPNDEDYFTLTFTSNGKAISTEYNEPDTTDYYVLNSDLYIYIEGEYIKTDIKTLNSSSLNIYAVSDLGDGLVAKTSTYFSRISK